MNRADANTRLPWWRHTWCMGISGALLLAVSFPPLDLWPLAWLAAIPWLLLIRWPELPGRRPYRALWCAGFLFWLLTVHWLRLPHPATSAGWLLLSFYLAFYVPLFVALSRVAVHRMGVSLVLAAPVVWTGLELLRGHLLSGFSMALLGHTQWRWLELIQIADLAGAYAVSFVVMFATASLTQLLPTRAPAVAAASAWRRVAAWWPALASPMLLSAVVAYGQNALAHLVAKPGPKVALIQGNIDSELKADPRRNQEIWDQYLELSLRARDRNCDLIVWPETMYRMTLITYTPDARIPEGAPYTLEDIRGRAQQWQEEVQAAQRGYWRAPTLLGVDTAHFGPGTIERYNSAVLIDEQGQLAGRYDKMHRVMFGEYIPFAEDFPWLYRLTPLTGGIQAGARATPLRFRGTVAMANICFESSVPHLIRRQVEAVRERGTEPDLLINLTNDGWFRGSSELDLHLTCGIFRAIELRKPFLAAANTGFSAWVDSHGRLRERGPRRDTGVLVATTQLDDRISYYSLHGDWPAGVCLVFCAAMAIVGCLGRGSREPQTT